MSFLLDDGQNGKKITSMLLSGNSDGIALQECIVWAGNTITLFEAKQRKKTQKHECLQKSPSTHGRLHTTTFFFCLDRVDLDATALDLSNKNLGGSTGRWKTDGFLSYILLGQAVDVSSTKKK